MAGARFWTSRTSDRDIVIEHVQPLVRRRLHPTHLLVPDGAVHENVYTAHRGDRPLRHLARDVVARQITQYGRCATASGQDFLDDAARPRVGPAVHHNDGTFLRKRFGDSLTDSSRRAGDERALIT